MYVPERLTDVLLIMKRENESLADFQRNSSTAIQTFNKVYTIAPTNDYLYLYCNYLYMICLLFVYCNYACKRRSAQKAMHSKVYSRACACSRKSKHLNEFSCPCVLPVFIKIIAKCQIAYSSLSVSFLIV